MQIVKISLAVSAVNASQDLLAMESRVYKIRQKMQFLSQWCLQRNSWKNIQEFEGLIFVLKLCYQLLSERNSRWYRYLYIQSPRTWTMFSNGFWLGKSRKTHPDNAMVTRTGGF